MTSALEVPAVRSSAGLSREDWTRTRHAAAFDVLLARGLARPEAWAAATALLGHWSIECSWGRAEWRFNVGNIKPGSAWRGPVQTLPDGLVYRAYDTLPAGVEDAVNLAAGTGSNPAYADAWRYLLATGDGVGWYDRLMRAGWHPWSEGALDAYRSTWARVRSIVGDAPPSERPSALAGVAVLGAVAGGFYLLARASRGPR